MYKVDTRQNIARHVTNYFFSTLFVQAVGMIRSIVIPILFSPAQLGVWNLMNVIIGYGGHAHLGLLHGMNKMIPFLKGQGKVEKLRNTKNTIFWTNLFIGISSGCLLLVISFVVPPTYAVYVQIVSIIVFVEQIFNYLSSLLRAESNFDVLIRGINIFSLLSTILVVGAAFSFTNRLLGALIGLTGSFALASFYWIYNSGSRFSFKIHAVLIRESFMLGFPLLIIGFLNTFFMSVDRWIITKYLNITAVGYYSIAVMASSLLATIPSSVSNVLYPRMLEQFAVNPEPKAMKNLLIGPLRATSVVMLLLISLATIGLPLLIRLFLPKYLPSIPIIEILIPSSFFLSITAVPGFYLISVDKQRYQIILIIFATLFSLLSDFILFSCGYGVIGIALGTAVGYLIYGLGFVFVAVYHTLEKTSEAVSFMAQLIAPFLVIILIIGMTSGFIDNDMSQSEQLISAIWRIVILMSLLLPTIWLFNRDGEVMMMARVVLKILMRKDNVNTSNEKDE
jgi:O-antigen/teichoic acid export membrane protein